MKITIGSKVFTATLVDNETVTAFKAMLPLTLKMTDLNANEKYHHLSSHLPTNATKPGTIHAGEMMLYGSNSLVLFYKTFSTSYSYTRIGKVDDASELAAALGSRDVTVTFAQ
ncbi:MAG: cyclophilin-like fold protein [Kofleriaceae bacterium]